jgi:acyl-CoA thioesterase-1
MVDASGQLQPDLSDDGLHPNSKGYRVMSPLLLDAVGRAAAQDSDESPQSKRRFRLLGK